MEKNLICILPGLTDVKLQDLNGLTPLECACTENLDHLKEIGTTLNVQPTENLDSSLFSFLSGKKRGLALKNHFEALSLNIKISDQKDIFSVRFISVENDTVVNVSDKLITDSEGAFICKFLNQSILENAEFIHLKGSRAILICENLDFDYLPFNINPIETLGEKIPESNSPLLLNLTKQLSETLMKNEINALRLELGEPLVNGILITSGGKQDIEENKSDMAQKTLFFTTSNISKGIAKSLNLKILDLGFEKRKYDHLEIITSQLDSIFKNADCFIVELPYIWQSTYNGNLLEKIKTIEWVDRNFIFKIKKYCLEKNCALTIMPMCNSDITKAKLTGGFFPAFLLPKRENMGEAIPLEKLLETIIC